MFEELILIAKDVLALFGGIATVVFLTIKFCKQIIEKYIYTQIEIISQKELEKVKNNFAKSMSAYEILLKKEFEYYEHIDKMYSKLIVNIQDIYWFAVEAEEVDFGHRCEELRDISCSVLKMIPELKDYNLMYQVYVPMEIFNATGSVVVSLQNGCDIITQSITSVFEEKEVDKQALEKYKETVLKNIAFSSTVIRSRLEILSE